MVDRRAHSAREVRASPTRGPISSGPAAAVGGAEEGSWFVAPMGNDSVNLGAGQWVGRVQGTQRGPNGVGGGGVLWQWTQAQWAGREGGLTSGDMADAGSVSASTIGTEEAGATERGEANSDCESLNAAASCCAATWIGWVAKVTAAALLYLYIS